ncbi:MAG: ATP-binding cassette domain-containing protein [Bacteroidota bacterium]
MTVLAIRDLTIRLGGRALLEGARAQVDDGREIGLIGCNGAGKSTLLRAMWRRKGRRGPLPDRGRAPRFSI